MTLDQQAIRELLPHRPPLLLPREVEILTPGERGVGRVRLDLNTPLWGECKARVLYRELVLEAAAQVLGLVLASAQQAEPEGAGDKRHLLLGFGGVVFLPEARPEPEPEPESGPESELDIEVTLTQRLGAICRGRFAARHGAGEIAHGELTVMQG